MFAVIKTGGKQYKVAPNDILRVEKLAGQVGETVAIDSVLMIETEAGLQVGAPAIEGASVAAEVIEQTRGPKIIVFKKQRRKNHRRRHGHRQDVTVLRVTEILTDGKKPAAEETPAKKTAAKKAPAKKTAKRATPKTGTPKTGAPETGASETGAPETGPSETGPSETGKE